jgi:hypothetical protein
MNEAERDARMTRRLAELVGEVRARLALICVDMPPERFEEMVLNIARNQIRSEYSHPFPDRDAHES